MDVNIANSGLGSLYGMNGVKDAGTYSSAGINSAISEAMANMDDLCQTVFANMFSGDTTDPASVYTKGASAGKASDSSALGDYSSGKTTSASSNFFDSLTISKPSAESIKDMFKGLDEKSLKGLTEEQKVEKYCKTWMEANGMDPKAYDTIKKQFDNGPLEKLKKELTVKYADKLEAKDASVDDYYEMMLDMQYPDMDKADREALVKELKTEYIKQEKKMKKLGKELEKELGDDPTIEDYFKVMLKRQNPELAKPENKDKLAQMAKEMAESDDVKEMEKFYEEVGEIFEAEGGVDAMLDSAKDMVGKGTNAAHGNDLDGQYDTITERMQISQVSAVNSKHDKWDVGFVMNQMSGSNVLDISSALETDKKGNPKFDLTKYDEAVAWSKKENIWKEGNGDYTPKPGDAIVFDNEHMGIISKIQDGKIYTIEGGLTDQDGAGKYVGGADGKFGSYVGTRVYDLGDKSIVGYIDPASQQRSDDKKKS